MIRKIFLLIAVLSLTSCISQLINPPINYKSQVKPGISQADTLALFDFPEQLIKLDNNKTLFIYPETVVVFDGNKQSHIFTMSKTDNLQKLIDEKDSRLNISQEIPEGMTNTIIFNKDPKNKLTPYQAFAYLGDEANFIESIKQKFVLDYYNTTSNALCLAISSGFVNATKEVVVAGAYQEALLKDSKSGRDYITPRQCVRFLNDPVKLSQIEKILNPPEAEPSKDLTTEKTEAKKQLEENKKNEVIEGILEWLKPVDSKKADDKNPQPSDKK